MRFREIMQAKHKNMRAYRDEQHQGSMNQFGLVLSAEQMDENVNRCA